MLGPFLTDLHKHIANNYVFEVVSGQGKTILTMYYEWYQVMVKLR